ncbi:hypothetical protein [Microbacterium sp.]|uniref:hypothetical protein n=1 Tax=Microbacterium sp. TaxID=51671 RepID=UPI00391CADAB
MRDRRWGRFHPTGRRVRRAAGWLLPVTAVVVVIVVLRSAGVPVTVPGVVVTVVVLFLVRVVIGWSRRGRRDRPITPRDRSR